MSVVIAILDTGIHPAEPGLASLLLPGATFVPGTGSTADDNGHGTAVARVAAAPHGGVPRSSYPPPLLLPVKVADAAGRTDDRQVARGIRWAVDHGARVINLSLWTEDIPEMRSAVAYARNKGAVVVSAAGNGGERLVFPADYPGVIAVGDLDSPNRQPRPARGSRHFVLASSHSVALHGNEVNVFAASGYTSLAAPRVSRLAATLLSLRPDAGAGSVIAAIEGAAGPVGGKTGFSRVDGWGAIDTSRSIRLVLTHDGTGGLQAAGS